MHGLQKLTGSYLAVNNPYFFENINSFDNFKFSSW